MKNSIIKNSLVIFLISIITSCTKVIDVDVPNGGARLVIEASINWEKGTAGNNQTIKLSTSTAYFDNNPNTPVIGANVSVTKDDDGTQFNFIDQNSGTYNATNFVPEIGKSYTLTINYNGETYQAKETLTGVNTIKRVEQEEGFNDGEYRVKVFFDDPKDIANFYLGEFTQDNLKVPSLAVVDDEFTDGNEAFLLHIDELNTVGTTIDIKVFGISQRFQNYMQLLIEQSGTNGGGGPFQTTPAKLTGNCKNVNNPTEEVLGYFRLSEFTKSSYTIQ